MSKKPKAANVENEILSVEEIEAQLKASPNDLGLHIDLAYALVDRHIYGEYGEADYPTGRDVDIKRLKEIVAKLPQDKAFYPRAYLSRQDNREQDFIKWSVKWISEISENDTVPYNCDELYLDCILPFEPIPSSLWGKWAETLAQAWDGSAAVFTLRGLAKVQHDNKPEEAVDDFVFALDKDPNYWLATWMCARIYDSQKNWQSALPYYLKALKAKVAQKLPNLHFDAAWCLGKLKKYKEEEKHYRICLKLYSDFPNARNNLGWALLKQKKNEEALKVFNDAIKLGVDGETPFGNKARVLTKLGRYTEAIETWQQLAHQGKNRKSIQTEIARARID